MILQRICGISIKYTLLKVYKDAKSEPSTPLAMELVANPSSSKVINFAN
jgi:hypothetical protein